MKVIFKMKNLMVEDSLNMRMVTFSMVPTKMTLRMEMESSNFLMMNFIKVKS
jgi:hypothetical protein